MKELARTVLELRADLLWLSAGLGLAVAPHAQRIPLWMPLLFIGLAAWRLYLEHSLQGRIEKPSFMGRLGRQAIMLVIVVGVFNTYGTLVGRDAGVALLVLLAGVKLLECQRERDYYISAFIAMFLVLTNFLYSQTILAAVHMLLTITVLVTALVNYNDPDNFVSTKIRLKFASSMLLQAIPMLLILFVLFPRIDGPLWGLPKDALSGSSGLDDEMSPGQISQLSLSNEVAFRVEFFGDMPDKSSLYWRGPVLWYSDGVKWVRNKRRSPSPRLKARGDPIKYAVTMEATDKNWLYALEMPGTLPPKAYYSHDMQILTRSVVRSRRRFEMNSFTDYILPEEDESSLQNALQLPQGHHQRSKDLAVSWREQGLDDREIVNQALRMFNTEAFFYTLEPPLLLEDSVDQFLFDTRQGFCEHYASAFVILMRAAGVPARVVTGYQGGSVNPVGNYLVVRQRDAHAWAEVWLGDEGWVRIDPTAAVAPERIRDGIENALPESIIDIPLGIRNNQVALDMWRRISYRLDALNNRWNQWILGYNNKRQNLFLNYIGFGEVNWKKLTGVLLALIALVLLTVGFYLFRSDPKSRDEARLLYNEFCRRLSRCGIERRPSEGPRDFARRASQARRDLATKIEEITRLYIDSRYHERRERLEGLRAAISTFKPRPLTAGRG